MPRIELKTGLTLAGGFVLARSLGCGNGSEVWAARRREGPEGADVAVKVLSDKGRYPRLCAQAAAMGRLFGTERTVHLVEAHLYDDPTFIAYEPLVAGNLAERLAAQGPLGRREALEVFRDVLRGLAEAHERGVPHGDLKPANVLLDETGRALLTDFEGDVIPADGAPPPSATLEAADPPSAASDLAAAGALLETMTAALDPLERASLCARCSERAITARALLAEVETAIAAAAAHAGQRT